MDAARDDAHAVRSLPDDLVAGTRLQAERDAELLCRFLATLGETEEFERIKPPTAVLPVGIALGLAAMLRMCMWERHGLIEPLAEVKERVFRTMGQWLRSVKDGATSPPAAVAVSAHYLRMWVSCMAWDGAADLDVDVVLDRPSGLADDELELMADFLWKHR